jgi:mycothiol S-conjugate amidase
VSLRLMAVHAHPDDESSKGSATMAMLLHRGVEVMVVSCTGGERGDILNEAVASDPLAHRDLPGLRRREMAEAQRIVGFQHRWLGYTDSGMAREDGTLPPASFASVPVETSAAVLVRLVRAFKPHVITTYDENGGYPHPDHIRSHVIAVEAYEAAGDPTRYPDAGEPWDVSKLYYDESFSSEKIEALGAWVGEHMPGSPQAALFEEMRSFRGRRESRATTHVGVSGFFDVRDRALRAHASQVAPETPYFFWPNEINEAAWPHEDYMLAASRVATSIPETDLFAGVTEETR